MNVVQELMNAEYYKINVQDAWEQCIVIRLTDITRYDDGHSQMIAMVSDHDAIILGAFDFFSKLSKPLIPDTVPVVPVQIQVLLIL